MDSSDLQTTNSTGAMPTDFADNSSMITPSKRDIFLSTYRLQSFSLPDSIMHYIAKNPKNSNVYQKMIKRCKYFFIKNPILILSSLCYDYNGWRTWVNETWKNIDINTISAKLWITDQLSVFPENVNNNSIISSIIPKIYQCNIKRLNLKNEIISLNEFMFLCSDVRDLTLEAGTVKNDDGTIVLFEKLIKQLPNVKQLDYTFTTPSDNTSKITFKELWKISNLSNYDDFYLSNIPEDFDINSFYSFMKKNKKIRIRLDFSDTISEEYKVPLEAIINEIIGTHNHGYKPPCIFFPGINQNKRYRLFEIFFR